MPETTRVPANVIATVNRLVRTSRRMLQEIGREPTAEELAQRLAMPLEKVRRLMGIAGLPLRFEAPAGAP